MKTGLSHAVRASWTAAWLSLVFTVFAAENQPGDRHEHGGALVFHKEPVIPPGYKLVYEQNFEKPEEFIVTDAKAWRRCTTNRLTALELAAQSKYSPPVRSPVNIALVADRMFGDFVLEADLMQTGREYGHRDMCLYFGFKSPTQFYYAHLATAADNNAHNIFVVTNAPRIRIARETTQGVNWGLGVWHRVRLERKLADGTIKVFFDDLTRPIMVANDKTLTEGYVGFGSFDDTGMVDNVRIWAPAMQTRKPDFFIRTKP